MSNKAQTVQTAVKSNELPVKTEKKESQPSKILPILVAEFDSIIKEHRGMTLREAARNAGFKFPLLDGWRNENPNTDDRKKELISS